MWHGGHDALRVGVPGLNDPPVVRQKKLIVGVVPGIPVYRTPLLRLGLSMRKNTLALSWCSLMKPPPDPAAARCGLHDGAAAVVAQGNEEVVLRDNVQVCDTQLVHPLPSCTAAAASLRRLRRLRRLRLRRRRGCPPCGTCATRRRSRSRRASTSPRRNRSSCSAPRPRRRRACSPTAPTATASARPIAVAAAPAAAAAHPHHRSVSRRARCCPGRRRRRAWRPGTAERHGSPRHPQSRHRPPTRGRCCRPRDAR